jgi:hypothetical protein
VNGTDGTEESVGPWLGDSYVPSGSTLGFGYEDLRSQASDQRINQLAEVRRWYSQTARVIRDLDLGSIVEVLWLPRSEVPDYSSLLGRDACGDSVEWVGVVFERRERRRIIEVRTGEHPLQAFASIARTLQELAIEESKRDVPACPLDDGSLSIELLPSGAYWACDRNVSHRFEVGALRRNT